jgi:DNA-binding CsgD family transcriptional regulator
VAPEWIATTQPLVGRAPELAVLHRALDGAVTRGCALLLRGDPGVGKSALLEAVAGGAADRGWRVLRTDGTPAEQRLPLAGLHKLLRPVHSAIGGLPRSRRETLEGAFGAAEADLDVFRVALATLDLLSAVAAAAPVALLIDDAQWLDQASAEIFAFVARRLEADPVLLVAASRSGDAQPLLEAGLPELAIGPLDGATAVTLLDRTSPVLGAATREAVLDVAAGNPLALLELPRSLPAIDVDEPVDRDLLLSRRLERAFLGRAREMPPATQDLLLLAAIHDSDDAAEVVAGATLLAGSLRTVEDLDPAVADGLVRMSGSALHFRHPLVRSAVQQGMPAGRRRSAHAALASVVADQADRSAWHRASAVLGYDESAAAQMDAVAVRAQRRGSVSGALQALVRAAELSESDAARGRRLLRAAEVAAESGRSGEGRVYRERSRSLLVDPHDRLRLAAVEEVTDESMGGGAARVDALIGLADDARHHGDGDLALRFLLRAAMRCWHLDFGPDVEQRVVAATDRLQLDDRDPRRLVIYAYAAPFDRGADVIQALTDRSPRDDDDPADLLMLGYAGACTGAYAEAEIYCSAAADGLREQGRLVLLAEALSLLTWSTLRRSRWQVALPAAEECVRVAHDIGHPVPEAAGLAALAAIAGMQGQVARAETFAVRAEQLATATRNTIGLAVTHLARGLRAAGQGRYEEAYDQFWHLYDPSDPGRQRMQACRTIAHLAEAAARTGQLSEARAELAAFEPLASRTPALGVQVAVRAARAVLAEPEDAEAAFTAALAGDWRDWAFEHGRLLLAHGRWLRRHQRVRESRGQLRAAVDAFVRSGAVPWAEQARRELRAAGEAAADTTGPATAWAQLSRQETQIARMVIDGLSNKEIGERLYLSPRTVGSHLYRMFPKLGVTSRTQLARALGTGGRPAPDPLN